MKLSKIIDRITGPVQRIQALTKPPRLPEIPHHLLDAVEATQAAGEAVEGDMKAGRIRYPAWAHYLEHKGYLRIRRNWRRPYEWLAHRFAIYTLWADWIGPQTGAGLYVFADLFTHKGKPVDGQLLRKKSNMAPQFDPATLEGLERVFFPER